MSTTNTALNPIDLVGRITATMIKYILLSIFFGIVMNWVFVIIFFGSIRNAERLVGGIVAKIFSVIVLLIFIIVFPAIYLWNMRIMAVTSTIKVIWGNYRQQIVEFVINRICKSTYATQIQRGQHALSTRNDWFSDLPIVAKWFFGRIKGKIPVFDKLEIVLKEVDFNKVCDEQQLQQELQRKMLPYIESSQPVNVGGGFRTLVGINIGAIIVTIILVSI